MKKFFTLFLTFIFSVMLYAAPYEVVSVVGNVYVGDSLLKEGQLLEDDDILNIRPQASITLSLIDGIVKEKRTFRQANNKIAVKDVWVMSALGKQVLKKKTIVKSSAVAADVDSSRKGVATASTRASDAKEDYDWDE